MVSSSRTSFDTALKQLKAMGFDETSIRRAHGALQVADAGLLAEWMLERPERGTRSAAAVCINESGKSQISPGTTSKRPL